MDPLFKAYGTGRYQQRDHSIRYVEERDIPAIAELFTLNYGDGYIASDVYDGRWVKRSIHRDDTICLVLEFEGRVAATGSVVLSYGDYNDKSGELARLVVHPACSRLGFGKRVIDALIKIGENSLEFAIAEARTAHRFSQEVFEQAGFPHIGFVPQLLNIKGRRESLVWYAKLHGNGEFLRSPKTPYLIPEAMPLADSVLTGMGFKKATVQDKPFLAGDSSYIVRPLDRSAVGPLLRIPNGRLTDPLLFGNISIEQGFTFVRDKAHYLVAYDESQNPVGTIGFKVDEINRVVRGIELIARNDTVWPALCRMFIKAGEELNAAVLSVEVSAYRPELQRLFFDNGFRPVAYAPARAFHGTERLDVVTMLKLNVPYEPGEISLTEQSKKMVSLVEVNF